MSPGSPAPKPEVLSLADIPEHELLCPIASGAYGQVWLARNRLGVYRAVKIVHRASFDHDRPFEREFAGIKAFEPISRSHEGLVDLLQVGRDDAAGYFYYVMELADDLNADCRLQIAESQGPVVYAPRTLASEVKCRGRLPLDECIRIGLSLTEALAYLHGQGLVHRDIKPSNIIFVGGAPKLADVGLVAAVADARSFVGTEGFIAPEGPGTPEADLYSLGIVLYVLSTGKSHQDFPEPPADLSSQANHAQWLEFDAVVQKACQARTRNRYQRAEEMRDDLQSLQRGQSVKRKRAAQERWRLVLRLGIFGCVLGLLVPILGALRGMPGHTPSPEAVRLYKLGQWHYNQCTTADHQIAFKFLTEAATLDPKYPDPYGELIAIYGWADGPHASTDQERLADMREIANKLVAIDPNLAQTHEASSFCKFLERDWHGAEKEIKLAIKASPDFAIAHFFYCFYLCLEGKTAEAEREGQQAQELESPGARRVTALTVAWSFMAERRFDRAIAQLRQVLELDRNYSYGHWNLGDCYVAQSNYLAAIEEYRIASLHAGEDPTRVAEVFGNRGELCRACETSLQQGFLRKWLELAAANKLLPREKQLELLDYRSENVAGCYASLGEKDKALDEIEKHFDEPNSWSRIKFCSLYDSLHDEPRYKALVKRAGLEP